MKSTLLSIEDAYKEHFSVVYKTAYAILRSYDQAEDVAQEVFIRYADHHDRLSKTDYAKYWLMRVSKNLAINLSKRKEREKVSYKKLFFQSSQTTKSVDEEFLRHETADMVKTAIDLLPTRYREILVMYEYGGFSYKEIAKTLRVSIGNVKVRMFRARKKIAELVLKYYGSEAYERLTS